MPNKTVVEAQEDALSRPAAGSEPGPKPEKKPESKKTEAPEAKPSSRKAKADDAADSSGYGYGYT